MNHHPNPNKNAPSSSASSAPAPTAAAVSSPCGALIEIPSFLPRASSTSGTSTAEVFELLASAVDLSSTPGMARNAREQNSERCIDLPSFLHCARPAHDGMKPDPSELVISINTKNVERTQ